VFSLNRIRNNKISPKKNAGKSATKGIVHAAIWAFFSIAYLFHDSLYAQTNQIANANNTVRYGSNPSQGGFASVNGIQLYYEAYGNGQVVLQIHGNGGSIAGMTNQVKFFSDHYRVLAVDSRAHGKSQTSESRLTYEQMAEDYNALLDQLNLKSVYVIGVSDGGIIGLLLAIKYPDKVAKLAIVGANLTPDGAFTWAQEWVAQQEILVNLKIAQDDKTKPWARNKQLLDLLGKQPNIPLADLRKIEAPTLVMAGDRDVIRPEHTLSIFENIKNSHLSIFPGSTHFIAQQDPKLFNETVFKFFQMPFRRPDTKDALK